MLDDAVREVRRVSHDLLQSNLAKFGLPKALEELRETLQAPGKFEVELSMHGMQERLEPRLEVVIYRIVQECVSNTMKHAKASHLSIQLTRSQGMVNLLVEDDGRGFDLASVEEGMGMGNIRQRTADLGGTVHFDARQGRGTSVSVDIPLNKK